MLKNLIEKAKSGLTEKPKKMRSKTVEVKSVHEVNGSSSNKDVENEDDRPSTYIVIDLNLMIFITIMSTILFTVIEFRLQRATNTVSITIMCLLRNVFSRLHLSSD